jgi:phosphohistidine phosphatase
MKLLVVRHAIAMEREEYQAEPSADATRPGHKDDALRPLTIEGIRKMRRNAKGLVNLVPRPNALITSPLTRAYQTAEILRDVWEGLDIRQTEALRPKSKPGDLVKWIRAHTDEDAHLLTIVGHEPHLTELIGWLLTGQQHSFLELKKGGACLLSFDNAISRSAGTLEWLATPAQLRALR